MIVVKMQTENGYDLTLCYYDPGASAPHIDFVIYFLKLLNIRDENSRIRWTKIYNLP